MPKETLACNDDKDRTKQQVKDARISSNCRSLHTYGTETEQRWSNYVIDINKMHEVKKGGFCVEAKMKGKPSMLSAR